MLLAVNMPEQEPQVGQPARSRASSPAAESLPSCLAAAATKTSIRSIALPVGVAAGFHRPAADENRGDIAAHGGHQHARHDLVAVGDADHAVEAMRAEHRLHRIGDDLAAGERIFHARVPHGDAVVHADGVEDEGHAAGPADALLDVLPDLVQVDVAGNDVHVAVADGDEGLFEIAVPQTGGAEEASMGGTGVAQLDRVGSHVFHPFGRRGLS